jgi:chromosome segregation protein
MAPRPGKTRSLPTHGGFELHALEWTAPDRLQVTGEFTSTPTLPAEEPVLAVRGAEGTHRLPAVPESLSGAPAEGGLWRAEFAWEVAPAPFDAAVLEFGDDIAIELRTPAARDAPATLSPTDSGAARLHLQSEMFALQADARAARAEADRLRTELARATEDLESERARHAVDADRFRQGLATVESVAQEALAEEKSVAQELGTELERTREALNARDAELQRVRAELEAAGSASSELGALRERVAELERHGEEAAQARADLEHAEAEAQRARAESERLSSRIARIREALDDPM